MTTGVAFGHFDGYPNQPCDNQPPATARRPITVPVSILTIPSTEMFAKCRKQPGDIVIYGCTFLPGPDRPAQIFLNDAQSDQERVCTLLYEEAHLPPNNWLDQVMEAMSPDATPQAASSILVPGPTSRVSLDTRHGETPF